MLNKLNQNLKNYLDKGNIFKLICGAGNEDYNEIAKLCAVYNSVGVKLFDVAPNINALKALNYGLRIISSNRDEGFFCISVGTKTDQHFTKYKINQNKCSKCGECTKACLQDTILLSEEKNYQINPKKCIGCAKCLDVCNQNAIESYYSDLKFEDFLPPLFDLVDCIEFHIGTNDIAEIDRKWDYLCENYNGFLGICVNRANFSDNELIIQLRKMLSKRAPYTVIIQADGRPMSSYYNDYRTTLQAISILDVISHAGLPAYLLASGGTNPKTKRLATMCEITNYTGIAYGTYARNLIKPSLNDKDFLQFANGKFEKAAKLIKKTFQINQ